MKRILKILLFCLIALIILWLAFSFIVPEVISGQLIKITQIKSQYTPSEDILISGVANKKSSITVFFNKRVGSITSDENGKWIVNLGKMKLGKYPFQVVADDSALAQSTATTQVIVSKTAQDVSLLDSVYNFFTASLSGVSKETPKKLITIPEKTPQSLQGGWKLIK
jgi:hypothetical protein